SRGIKFATTTTSPRRHLKSDGSGSMSAAESQTFNAAVVEKFGQEVTVKEIDLPQPGPNQALVKVLTSGICHTDLHALEGDWPVKPAPPFVPGHEGVGEVVELGPGEHDVKVGDIVGNAWLWSACGTCEFCITGRETHCPDAEYGDYTQN